MTHLDMTGYRLAPRDCKSAAEVMEIAARVRSSPLRTLRAPVEHKIIPTPPPLVPIQLREPALLEMVKWPDWVEIGEQPSNLIAVSFPVVRPVAVHQVYPSIKDIIAIVAKFYRVTVLDILSSRRTAQIVYPRQVAAYLCKTLTPRSLPEIGRRMGDRDHTTILHAVRKIERLLGTDERLADEVTLLLMKISDHLAAQSTPTAIV